MLIATRLFAGMTKNGNGKRLIVINECRENGCNLHKVIKFSNHPGEYEKDLFNGEFNITPKEYRELIQQAKELNCLVSGF